MGKHGYAQLQAMPKAPSEIGKAPGEVSIGWNGNLKGKSDRWALER
jgi:hypothetical protein